MSDEELKKSFDVFTTLHLCSRCIAMTKMSVRLVGGGDPFYLKFWVNWPPLEQKRRF